MKENGKAVYLDTGTWASKARNEAKLFGETITIASSKDSNYNYIPKNYIIPKTHVIFTALQIIRFMELK